MSMFLGISSNSLDEIIERHYHESSQVRMVHSGTIKIDRNNENKCSIVEIDGKKLLEEIK